MELVYPSKDDPHLLATLGLAYSAMQLAGTAAYGIEAWTAHADGFYVYFLTSDSVSSAPTSGPGRSASSSGSGWSRRSTVSASSGWHE
jgi:hypothetical protein